MCVGDAGWPRNFRGFVRRKLDFLETRYVLKRWSTEWPVTLEHVTWGSAVRTVLGWRLMLPLQAGIGDWHEGKNSSEDFLHPSSKAVTSLEDLTVLRWVNQALECCFWNMRLCEAVGCSQADLLRVTHKLSFVGVLFWFHPSLVLVYLTALLNCPLSKGLAFLIYCLSWCPWLPW